MKTLSLNVSDTGPKKSTPILKQEVPEPQPLANDELASDDVNLAPEPVELPERLFTDIQVAGFPDVQSQEDSFFYVSSGIIPVVGDVKIFEVAAKRGDMYDHLKNYNRPANILYTGIDTSDLMVAVGDKKHESDQNFRLIHGDFDLYDFEDQRYDIIMSSLCFINNFGISENMKYSYLERFLDKTLAAADYHVSLLFLHDNGGDDAYLSYPVINVIDSVLKYNFAFTLDFGKIPDMYKITIDTRQKRYL